MEVRKGQNVGSVEHRGRTKGEKVAMRCVVAEPRGNGVELAEDVKREA